MKSDFFLNGSDGVPTEQVSKSPQLLIPAALLVVLMLLVTGAYRGSGGDTDFSQPSPSFLTATAHMGDVAYTIPAVGTVALDRQAQLSFGMDGKLLELEVTAGEPVKAGQSLARLDTKDLAIKVAQAESAVRTSQLKLKQLQEGASPEELSAAKAAVEAATAKYQEVSAGPARADLQAAQSAVEQRAAAVAAAQARLDQLKQGTTEAEMTAAQAQAAQFKASLSGAEARLAQLKAGPTQAEWATASGAVDAARANLQAAEARLEDLKAGPTGPEVVAAQAQVDKAKAAVDEARMVSPGQGESPYAAARAQYDAALERLAQAKGLPRPADLQDAQSKVDAERANLAAAEARVEQMKKGPLPADVAAAQDAVDAAKASLSSAEAKLALLKAGPTAADVLAAESALAAAKTDQANAQAKLSSLQAGPKAGDVESARSALTSAQSQLALRTAGPNATALALAEEQVKETEISLSAAKMDLEDADLVAPFDGVVAAVGHNAGEQVQRSDPVITLVDPKAIRVDVTVGERDVTKLSPGQQVMVNLDALGEQNLRSRVIAVSPIGTRDQNMVSYLVSIGINSPDRTVPAGMTAKVSIEAERKEKVLLVPNAAVRNMGLSRTVQVLTDGGMPQDRTVRTGATDGQFTEIVSGLKEGDQVVVRTTYQVATSKQSN